MFKVKKIDHVAIAVENIDEAIAKWRTVFGVDATNRELVGVQKTEIALVPLGESDVELLEPKGNEGLAKFLKKRGPGLHHIAVEVEGIEKALEVLRMLNIPLVDEKPHIGARGHKVAFLHPKATGGVLVELVERDHDHAGVDDGGPS